MPIPIVTFNKPLNIELDDDDDNIKYSFDLETKKALLYLMALNKRMNEIQKLKNKVLNMFEGGVDQHWDIYVEYNHISSLDVGEKIIEEETKMIEQILGINKNDTD